MLSPTTSILCLAGALLLGLLLVSGCAAGTADSAPVNARSAGEETLRGSGSVGRWRARPGQRTVFDRGFAIPTTLTFRADAGSWSGTISIVDRSSQRSLCERTISGGGQASCSGIQGSFRLTVANAAQSRDVATGDVRFNN